jgi:hypothetical protein
MSGIFKMYTLHHACHKCNKMEFAHETKQGPAQPMEPCDCEEKNKKYYESERSKWKEIDDSYKWGANVTTYEDFTNNKCNWGICQGKAIGFTKNKYTGSRSRFCDRHMHMALQGEYIIKCHNCDCHLGVN